MISATRQISWGDLRKRELAPFRRITLEMIQDGLYVKKRHQALNLKRWEAIIALLCLLVGLYWLIWKSPNIVTTRSGISDVEAGGVGGQATTQPINTPASTDILARLPVARNVIILTNQQIYGYSSTINQTDNSPCISANGYNLCAASDPTTRSIANNCLEFGSRVSINGITFSVFDRMNERYDCDDWDIWFPIKQEAINWGSRTSIVKIIKN